jgi:cell shape-determining protein MreC
VQINKGSSDGVAVNQPVVNGKGLVGEGQERVGRQRRRDAPERLDFGVLGAGRQGAAIRIDPAGRGLAGDLLFDLVPDAREVHTGDVIVTAGTISAKLPSPFPRAIPIGVVKRIEGEGDLDRTIHVKPYADLRDLDFVQVLTKPTAELRASTTP